MASFEVLIQGKIASQLPLPEDEQPSRLQFLALADESQSLKLTSQPPSEYLAAIMRASGRWVLMAPPGNNAISVNQVPIISLKVLDHGDNIDIADIHLHLIEERSEILTEDAPLIQQEEKCPVCKEHFNAGDRVIYCPRCQLAYHFGTSKQHDDCWHYLDKCASHPFCGYIIHDESGEKDRFDT